MKKQVSFTIIELLIAMSIGSFIVLGMTRGYQNVQKIVAKTRTLFQFDKSISLTFNQIERDINTAFIPFLAKEESSSLSKKKKGEGKESKKKKPESKTNTIFFIGSIYEDRGRKINNQKYELFNSISLVNTNPLQVWGQKRSRLVRVGYELVKNKNKSQDEKDSYDLFRKETRDLKNETFKAKEDIPQKQASLFEIKTELIVTNIKEMFIKYTMRTQPEKEGTKEKIISLFEWGKSREENKQIKETENSVPEKVMVRISLWDETLKTDKTFECIIPVLTYPTIKPAQPKNAHAKEKPKPGREKPTKQEKNLRIKRGQAR